MTVLLRWIALLGLLLALSGGVRAQDGDGPVVQDQPPEAPADPEPAPPPAEPEPPATDREDAPVEHALQQTAEALRQAGQAPRDPQAWRDILDAIGALTLLAAQWMLMIAVVILLALLLLRVIRRVLDGLQRSRSLPEAIMTPIRRAIRYAILLLVLLVVLQIVGVPLGAVWAALSAVVVLIAVGFIAVWSVLSNMTCSVMLMIFKPFRIGDHVEIVDNPANPGLGGRVVDVTLMYVVLKDETEAGEGSLIQIPNNIFFQRALRRRSGRKSISLEQHMEQHGLTGKENGPAATEAAAKPLPR